jgi:hypothetical protein
MGAFLSTRGLRSKRDPIKQKGNLNGRPKCLILSGGQRRNRTVETRIFKAINTIYGSAGKRNSITKQALERNRP